MGAPPESVRLGWGFGGQKNNTQEGREGGWKGKERVRERDAERGVRWRERETSNHPQLFF